jgi:hypothetical protein
MVQFSGDDPAEAASDHYLTDLALEARSELIGNYDLVGQLCPDMWSTVGTSLAGLKRLSIVSSRSNAAFGTNRAQDDMVLNGSPLRAVVMRARHANQQLPPCFRLEASELDRIATSLFLFHEAAHLSQGIGDFRLVQAIKNTFGREYLAELDLIADIDSARAVAINECAARGGQGYPAAFAAAIAFMMIACFPVFGFSTKASKISRALGLILSYLLAESAGEPDQRSPLLQFGRFDRAHFPLVTKDKKLVAIKGLWTGGQLVSVHKVRPQAMKELVAILDSGAFHEIIAKARGILMPAE